MCTHMQVNVKVKGKTGLMVATAEGWPVVVTTLLDEFEASVNETVYIHALVYCICTPYQSSLSHGIAEPLLLYKGTTY